MHNTDSTTIRYEAPDCCSRLIESTTVITQSTTGEAYEDPVEYDGF